MLALYHAVRKLLLQLTLIQNSIGRVHASVVAVQCLLVQPIALLLYFYSYGEIMPIVASVQIRFKFLITQCGEMLEMCAA